MAKKLTQEEFIERAKEVHGDRYDYSKVEYKDSKSHIEIYCKTHSKWFIKTPNQHISRKEGCKQCGKESDFSMRGFTKEKFIEEAKKVHSHDKYDYSLVEYKGSSTKVKIICKEHGVFEQEPRNILKGKRCSGCAGNKRYSNEEYIAKAKTIFGEQYTYEKCNYKNAKTDVIITCKEHGDFEIKGEVLLRGHGCTKCSGTYVRNEDDVKEVLLNKFEGNISLVGSYVGNTQSQQEFVCNVCGDHSFAPLASKLTQKYGCTTCAGRKPHTFESLAKKVEEVWDSNIELLPNQEIEGVGKHYLFKHKVCGHIWSAKAGNILSKWGCPECNPTKQHTHETATQQLFENRGDEFKLLEKYKGSVDAKHWFVHTPCGNEFYSSFYEVSSGSKGCIHCTPYGYKTHNDAYFYILEIKGSYNFTGYGISNVIEKRYRQHALNLEKGEFEICSQIVLKSDGQTILDLETFIKTQFNRKGVSNVEGFITESTFMDKNSLLEMCVEWLDVNNKEYKIEEKES